MQLIEHITAEQVQKPHLWLAKYEENAQQSQQDYQQQKRAFEQQQSMYQQLEQQLAQVNVQLEDWRTQQQVSTTQLKRWQAQHLHIDEAQCIELAQITASEEQALRQQLQNIDHQCHEAQTILHTLEQQYQTLHKQAPELTAEAIEQQLTMLSQDLNVLQQQIEHEQLQLKLYANNQEKRQQFATQIQQIEQEEYRWSKISGLIGDGTGRKFRDFALQYYLDQLLEYANQQLQQLSQRYTLQRLENSLSLAIIDHDMDGEVRSVASLSGGESFLTALALSLAIANMASGELKIESLFIDEGFGTLDSNSLHLVMDALDRLQSQGRKVVIISHIQEMHERIPVQIQVNTQGSGSSRIDIVG